MVIRSTLFGSLIGLLSLVCVVSIQPKPSTPAIIVTPAPTVSPVELEPVIAPSPIPAPALTATPAVINTPTDIPTDTGWQSLRPGLERRSIPWIDADGKLLEQFYVVRIDPAQYRFDVVYRAKNPLTLTEWLAETGALLVINGSYFSHENNTYTPTGLTIIEGNRFGSDYGDFAGMLAISEAGPSVRWLREQPYTPDEPLLAALQSFPLLVRPGGILGFPAENEDGRAARRTVLGQDRAGRIVVILASKGYPTLHQMSRYLTETDFDLDIALNLDGGKSSGILLAEPEEGVPALTALPIVITVFPR